jgi:hypothetical protein
MVADGDKISENIALKLFDQVRNSSDQHTNALKDLTHVVGDLTKCIEKQPDLNDMAKMCINRGHDVSDLRKTTQETNQIVKALRSRVGIMILTVVITFAVMTASYFFVRNSVENMIDRRVDEIHKVLEVEEGD